jgi:molecular chaperone Hsp33
MNLDDGDADCRHRVPDRVRVVSVRTGVDDDGSVTLARRMERIDDRAFGVVLFAANFQTEIFCAGGDRIVYLREPLRSIDFRFALAKQVEVRSVQNQNAHRHRFFGGKALASARVALMADTLLAASNLDAGVAVVAAISTGLVAEIRDRHDLWPTATAAVGRLATGAALFAAGLKGNERVSLQIAGDGPLGTIAADAWFLDDRTIGVRGYARNGRVELPVDARGKFDVAGAIGAGSLQVTRSSEVGQPYVGVVPIHSGEIAEDLAVYLAQSEQIPSIVALGVLANPNGVVAAGGILARALPGADERAIAALEARAAAMPPVTQLIARHADPAALLRELAGNLELRSHHTIDVRFACRCNRTKVETVLLGLGADELLQLTRERDRTEASCEYCKTRYVFTAQELRELLSG